MRKIAHLRLDLMDLTPIEKGENMFVASDQQQCEPNYHEPAALKYGP